MMTQSPRLPALPKPEVYRVTWDRDGGWSQYHDERDPLPSEWDDEPPDEVRGFFTGDQMLAAMAQAAREERERCAKVCDEYAKPGMWSGRYFVGYIDAARHIAANLRGEPIPESFGAAAIRSGDTGVEG